MGVSALFFDVGGVLGTNGWDRGARREAAERFGLDWEEFADRHELVVADLETGKMGFDEYLERTVFYRDRAFTPEEFRRFVWSRSRPRPDTLALVDRLAARGTYLLATLNNESRELNEHRIELFGLRERFSVFLSSCYLGIRKPEAEIYRLAMDVTSRAPSECLFIDDRSLNTECAVLVGMQAIQFDGDAGRLASALADRGIEL